MYFFVLGEEVSLWKLWQSLRILTVKVLGEKNSPSNTKISEQPWFQNKKKLENDPYVMFLPLHSPPHLYWDFVA